MCRPVTCKVCGKTTWAGCGQHVSQVKASVGKSNWCDGKHTDEQIRAAKPTGLLSRLFG